MDSDEQTESNRTARLHRSVFRIRIHLIRIRIQVQHFRLNTDPDPDQGLDEPKLKKMYSIKKFNFFFFKNYDLPISRPP
jgi:hypothetical protein